MQWRNKYAKIYLDAALEKMDAIQRIVQLDENNLARVRRMQQLAHASHVQSPVVFEPFLCDGIHRPALDELGVYRYSTMGTYDGGRNLDPAFFPIFPPPGRGEPQLYDLTANVDYVSERFFGKKRTIEIIVHKLGIWPHFSFTPPQ